jgi:hypothetical protein
MGRDRRIVERGYIDMADSNLSKYIEDSRAVGVSEDSIRAALLSAGWQKENIDEALHPIVYLPLPQVKPAQPAIFKFIQVDFLEKLQKAEKKIALHTADVQSVVRPKSRRSLTKLLRLLF